MNRVLKQYWPTLEESDKCIKTEAETAHESLILAVHQSYPLAKRSTRESDQTEIAVSEQALLDAFLTPNLPTGTLLLPITGHSGVGKSHMIRWLHAQLQRNEGYERMHVIRIPKSASLKKVVSLILDPLKGQQYDQLRSALQKAVSQVTIDTAGTQLRYGVEMALKDYLRQSKQTLNQASVEERQEIILSSGHAKALPGLFGDSVFREHYEDILGQIITRAIEGKSEDEEAQIPKFTQNDILLPDVSSLAEASKPVILYYSKIREDSNHLERAVNLLNDVLDDAIAYAFDLSRSLGGKSLQDIFLEIREQLLLEKKELVLLVEDFAALAGIQDPLLKICIQEGVRDGEQIFCPMRTAIAVTDGDWSGRDTVLTRAHTEWRIKSNLSSDDETIQRTIDLVGSYLNAARYGDNDLRTRYESINRDQSVKLTSWLPLYQLEELDDQTETTLQAFGKSQSGYWLFPFNRNAITQLANKKMREAGKLIFNPRLIINSILRNVLLQRDLFEKNLYPPPKLEGASLNAFASQHLSKLQLSTETRDRYSSLLRFWGGNPENIHELSRISVCIPLAFGLDALKEMQPGTGSAPTPEPGSAPTLEPELVRHWRAILEGWSDGTPIPQKEANQLRNWIGSRLSTYINWNSYFLTAPPNVPNDIYFRIPCTKGENSHHRPEIEVTDTNEDPDGYFRRVLLGLVRYESEKSWNYNGGDDDAVYCSDFLERLSGSVLKIYRDSADKKIALLASFCAWSNHILGEVSPAQSDEALEDIFRAIWSRTDKKPLLSLHENWDECRDFCWEHQLTILEKMNSVCAAFQGAGKTPHAIDAVRMSSLLSGDAIYQNYKTDEISSALKLDKDEKLVKRLFSYVQTNKLLGRLKTSLDSVRKCQASIQELIPGDESSKVISKEISRLVKDVKSDGSLWPSQVQFADLEQNINAFSGIDLLELKEAFVRILECYASSNTPLLVYQLGQLNIEEFRVVSKFLDQISVFIDKVDARLDEMISGAEGDDPEPVILEIIDAFEEVDTMLDELQEVDNVTS